MDLATLLGLLGGLTIVGLSILMKSSFGAFVDYASVGVVLGGAVCAVLISFPLRNFLGAVRVALKALFNRQEDYRKLIEQIVSLAETARRDGLLALEGRIEELSNPFVILGIQMAVDGTRPEVIEDVLRTEMSAVAARHKNGKSVIEQLGRFAPAFGMIGTLIGLVIMLGNMDPDTIGSGMAVALLTTLYGAIAANLVFLPIAEKLGFLSKHELTAMEIALRGIMAIQSGENPRVIEQKLNTFLPPKQRPSTREAA